MTPDHTSSGRSVATEVIDPSSQAPLARRPALDDVGELDRDDLPDLLGDLVLGEGAVDDRPPVGVAHGLDQEAVVDHGVERVARVLDPVAGAARARSEEHTSELQSLIR